MFGTLSVTSVNSDEVASLVFDEVNSDEIASLVFDEVPVVSETVVGVQPARVIANPAASNTEANRFMSISLGKKCFVPAL